MVVGTVGSGKVKCIINNVQALQSSGPGPFSHNTLSHDNLAIQYNPNQKASVNVSLY